ncbi:hypothetical protein Lser_V15G24245 [Lactuca serriola]
MYKIVWTNWLEGTCSNIKDPRIDADSRTITKFIHIGFLCVQEDAADRPTMDEVVSMLTDSSSLTLPAPKRTFITEKSPYIPKRLPSSGTLPSHEFESHDFDSIAVEDFINELCPR